MVCGFTKKNIDARQPLVLLFDLNQTHKNQKMPALKPDKGAPGYSGNGNPHLKIFLSQQTTTRDKRLKRQDFCYPNNHKEENIMSNKKSFKLAVITLASVAIFHSVNALADGALCSDWSYNDPSCPAYIKASGNSTPPVQIAENSAKQSSTGTLCADWSYNDPNCSSHIKSTGK